MVLHLSVEHFNEIKDLLFLSKEQFKQTIYYLVCLVPVLNPISIIFPKCLTRLQRHIIHTYSEKNRIDAYSTGEENERQMTVTLSVDFLQECKEKYKLIEKDDNSISVVHETNESSGTSATTEPTSYEVQLFTEFRNKILSEFKESLYKDLMDVIKKHF
jgi:hypothetical protein